MNDMLGNLAQDLADHLDDLRDTGEGVANYDEGPDYPVTDVSDATPDMVNNGFSILATIDGKSVRIIVVSAE